MVLTRHRAREENDNIQIRNERQNVEHSNSEELQIINTDEQCCSSYNGQSQCMTSSKLHMSAGDTHDNKAMSQSISNIEAKVASLENSLLHVTQELTNALKNLDLQNNRDKSLDSHRQNRLQSHRLAYSESDTDSDSIPDPDNLMSNSSMHVNRGNKHYPKLPPFTGKESWNVWFNRFENVAKRQRWTLDEKLDEILPRLQGIAGEFVYGQLNRDTRSDYKSLCKELSNRFRIVETSKTFWVQFSHRNQKCGETAEEYAAELKMLYDKAHVNRDKETRKEDLLRRFLDGLIDDKARFHVEFIKEPKNIDEAVFQTVCFQETKQKKRSYNENIRHILTDSDNSDIECDVARIAPGKNKTRLIKKEVNSVHENLSNKIETNDMDKLREIVRAELNALTAQQNQLEFHKSCNTAPKAQFMKDRSHTNSYIKSRMNNDRKCFYCHDPSHIKRNCPKLQNMQSQITEQCKMPSAFPSQSNMHKVRENHAYTNGTQLMSQNQSNKGSENQWHHQNNTNSYSYATPGSCLN